jgi:hypothetical protein
VNRTATHDDARFALPPVPAVLLAIVSVQARDREATVPGVRRDGTAGDPYQAPR